MEKRMGGVKEGQGGDSPSRLIDARIKELSDWRGETLARVRRLIREADPEVVEEWKWRGVPVWEHDGIICTGESYKTVVKMTFAKGASEDGTCGATIPRGPAELQLRALRGYGPSGLRTSGIGC
jgi:hypothetical protein